MPKRIPKKKSTRLPTPKAYLWLVPFTLHRPRTGQNGTFQMIVEALSPDDAMDRCRERLIEIAETTSLFKEPVILYSGGLLRLSGSFKEAVLFNVELPHPNGRLSNLMPDQPKHDAMMFLPSEKEPGPIEPFLTFGIEDGDNESAMHLRN